MNKQLQQIKKYVGHYNKTANLTRLFVILETFVDILIPFLIAKLIDHGIAPGDLQGILTYATLLVITAVLALVFGILGARYAALASSGFAKNLRQGMFYKIQDFSFKNIDKFSTASLVTRLTTDVTNMQNAYQMSIRIALRAPFMLVFALLMAFSIHLQMALIFIGILPVLGGGLYLIATKAHPLFKQVFKTYDRLNRVVQENLRGIRVVKAYVRETFEINKFKEVSSTIFKNFTKAERIVALNGPLMQFAVYASIILIAWFGGRMIVAGTLTTGELVSLITYAMQILMSLMMISMVMVMFTISRASADRILEVFNEEIDLASPENPVTEVKEGSVAFEHVYFAYDDEAENFVLKDINFTINPGETVGIIGSTGSAKSTLVQLIPRLYDVTKGRVLVGGIDVRKYDLRTLRDAVGMVLQKNVLFSGTIQENLRWGDQNATLSEIILASQYAQAAEFIERFPEKYDTYLEEGGTNVSGGQKQRLTIARALLKKPKILILDDSTSAVDTKTDAKIRQALREKLPGTTKIIIAQRVASVMDADKIIVLDRGQISGIGTHEELLETNEIYREVYESQTKGGIQLDA